MVQGFVGQPVSLKKNLPFDFRILITQLLLDSGDMTSTSREISLKKIAQDSKCTVIIVSIMAGGVGASFKIELRCQWGLMLIFYLLLSLSSVGLNITACNTVILLDPWWNPSAEVSQLGCIIS